MTPDRRPPPDARRVAAEKRGRRAERAATWFLRLKGYRLLASRFKTPVGEIDLVMRRGRTVVFVEVKERPDEAAGLDAVTAKARRRIARAADYWLAGHPDAAGFDLRFDIVVASPAGCRATMSRHSTRPAPRGNALRLTSGA